MANWGNIATDPKGLTTAGGVRITKFRLACSAARRDPQTGEFTDGVTSWYSVSCWRDLAYNVAASVTKGDPVVVYGKQVVREWTAEDGKRGTDVSIDAICVGHDLRRGQARFQRIKHGGPAASTTDHERRPEAAAEPEPREDPWAEASPPASAADREAVAMAT